MTQYDAGPGEWSDREWESPDRKPMRHARRRGPVLPPWALLAIVVGIVILLCVALVLLVKAIQGRGADETPVPTATATRQAAPTATWTPSVPIQTATPTVELPIGPTALPGSFTEIAPGATVTVQGTGNVGLNLRAQPTTGAAIVITVREGNSLTVLDGPQEADGLVWWKLRTSDGKEGWGAAKYLALKVNP
ncbi:MAG: SH3 domain-containing protein [Anaerolineae bacterium]|nr:SH3 domain-containing protein [Anaerolineae bacterium]